MSAGEALRRAILAGIGGKAELLELASRPWASATFAGERHRLALRLSGPSAAAAADAFLNGVSERAFDLPGHILADIALVGEIREAGSVRLSLEALTVEAS